jgi:predicted transcriptional regulator
MAKENFTANLPDGLADRIDQSAARQGISRDSLVQSALDAWLDHEEAAHRMTLEGLADVDAGRVVSQDAIEALIRQRVDP